MIKKIIKRTFDVVVSFIALIILLPLFIIISTIIFIETGFPVFYKQKRLGKNGKEFFLYKFRSMVKDADKIGSLVTVKNDPRITRSGKFLRKTKLDELPQFFNVLKGDMSLVGPRPEVKKYADCYMEDFNYILSKVKPGITDWASIKFRHEEHILESEKDFETHYIDELLPKKLTLAKNYADNNNLFIDLVILIKTVFVVILH